MRCLQSSLDHGRRLWEPQSLEVRKRTFKVKQPRQDSRQVRGWADRARLKQVLQKGPDCAFLLNLIMRYKKIKEVYFDLTNILNWHSEWRSVAKHLLKVYFFSKVRTKTVLELDSYKIWLCDITQISCRYVIFTPCNPLNFFSCRLRT